MAKSYDSAKQEFINSVKKPLQTNTTPVGAPLHQQFQSAGIREIAKGLGSQPLRPITESQNHGGKE